jgi:hypothetical protein
MVSSSASIHAERLLISEDLKKIFRNVVRGPEESTSGTPSDSYLQAAREADFMVVLLSNESRPAVVNEVKEAISAGTHVAGFALHYPPFRTDSAAWTPTEEEEYIRSQNLWVKNVSDINVLRQEVRKALAEFLALATNRFRPMTSEQTYDIAAKWLKYPSDIKRVALVQQTSTVFLGPRKGAHLEDEVSKSLLAIIGRTRKSANVSFIHVFDEDKTSEEAAKNSSAYQGRPSLGIRDYTRGRLHFSGISGQPNIGPLLVVDDWVGFGTSAGHGGSFVSVVRDRKVADEVFEAIRKNPKQVSREFLTAMEAAWGAR